MADADLAVVGIGMVSPVGLDAVNGCAAIRAGISRADVLRGYEQVGVVSDDDERVVGHRIAGVTEGFSFLGLWVRLADFALRDLMRYARLSETDSAFWRRTAIFCATPAIDGGRYVLQEEDDPQELLSTFGDILLEVVGLPVQSLHTIPADHVGAAVALDRARSLLDTNAADRAVILGIDSLADAHSVQWLAKTDRLKTGDRPNGLAPGEAGACVLLEPMSAAMERGVAAEAFIRDWFVSTVEAPSSGRPVHYEGRARADAIMPLLTPDHPFNGDIYSDLNGEDWRAHEFGNAVVRLRQVITDEATWNFPATSTGDTGAASGVVALCLAIRSLVRRYSKHDRVLVTSLSQRGQGAAIAVDRN
jgi:3-oxoacyl-[acyl-carrier-protein] synthase-1